MNFFDPNLHPSTLFEMGGLGHGALMLMLFALLGVLIVFRKQMPKLRDHRAFMAGSAAFVLGLETISYVFKFTYPITETFERLPLQLCSSLKIIICVLILARRYDLVKYVSTLAIGCGFISFVNLNLGGESFGNFTFWHYVIGHCYLFLAPVLLFLAGETRYEPQTHRNLLVGIGVWSFVIFLANWAFDTNWMYSGPHNTVEVPFLPSWMMQWPMNYVSYVLIAAVMLNGTYAMMRFCQARMDRRAGALQPAVQLAAT